MWEPERVVQYAPELIEQISGIAHRHVLRNNLWEIQFTDLIKMQEERGASIWRATVETKSYLQLSHKVYQMTRSIGQSTEALMVVWGQLVRGERPDDVLLESIAEIFGHSQI